MNIEGLVVGFLLGAAVGPAAGFYVGLLTGFSMFKNLARAVKENGSRGTDDQDA